MKKPLLISLALFVQLAATMASLFADEITYRKHIQPLWQKQCSACHGAKSPYLGEFLENEKKYRNMGLGPRMDSYPALVFFVGWPDAGAIMRRLDDGKSKPNGKAGNMYLHLGATAAERAKNLDLFKAWVGREAWTLNHWNQKGDMPGISKQELSRIRVKY